MSDPIDFKRERERRAKGRPVPRQPQRWITIGIIAAAVIYALLRAWQAITVNPG
jgi:hypothetical protein